MLLSMVTTVVLVLYVVAQKCTFAWLVSCWCLACCWEQVCVLQFLLV